MELPTRSRSFPAKALLGLALGLAGCGGSDGLGRQAVSGMVILDGQPLPQGSIQFIPLDKSKAVAGGAVIKDGKYAIDGSQGQPPGQYYVVINSGQAPAATPSNEPPGPVAATDAPKELVPARYNTATTLTADIKAGGSSTFDFDLKSK